MNSGPKDWGHFSPAKPLKENNGATWGHFDTIPIHARAHTHDGNRSTRPQVAPSSLERIAKHLGRLSPDWRNPERYFENRSEIEHTLRRLARELSEGS